MAVIDRAQLLADEKLWLPAGNLLSDAFMFTINDSVIKNQLPADSDAHFAEAVCKGLRAIAFANNAKFQVDGKGLKKEMVGDVSIELFESGAQNPWGDFIKTLGDICPIIGFTGLNKGKGFGIQITPSAVFKLTDEASASNLLDLDITQVDLENKDLFL